VPAGTPSGQANWAGGASLGTVTHPVNNSKPAVDRLKPNVAHRERKEIREYSMLKIQKIDNLPTTVGCNTCVIPWIVGFCGKAAQRSRKKTHRVATVGFLTSKTQLA
jgi:hypothetical protein